MVNKMIVLTCLKNYTIGFDEISSIYQVFLKVLHF